MCRLSVGSLEIRYWRLVVRILLLEQCIGFLRFFPFLSFVVLVFLVSWFLVYWLLASCFLCFLVPWFQLFVVLDFEVDWFRGFKISKFQRFNDPIFPHYNFTFFARY